MMIAGVLTLHLRLVVRILDHHLRGCAGLGHVTGLVMVTGRVEVTGLAEVFKSIWE